jgi:acetylornithine/succinyldiaminopimelate/putrescine aminotransferase
MTSVTSRIVALPITGVLVGSTGPITGVLIGSTGPHRNVLKVRPPLAFTTAHIASFITAWTSALHD